DQSATSYKKALEVNRRQFVSRRQCDDQFAVDDRQPARCDNQAAIRSVRKGCDVALNFNGVANIERAHFNPERWPERLDGTKLSDPLGYTGVTQDSHTLHGRRDVFEQL